MKRLLGTVLAAGMLVGMTGCSRNNIEAVNLANEADKEKTGNLDGAISKYEQATNLDPTNHRILWKLAVAYQKKEAWDRVASTCAKAEKLAPKFATYYALHGHALMEQAQKGPTGWADAKAPLEEATKLDPNLADAYFDLGEVYLHLDDEQNALQSYTKAINVKPDALSFYATLADLYVRLNHPEQAEQVLTQGLAFAKEGDRALFNVHSLLADVYDRKHDAAKTVAEYEAAKKACGQCNEAAQPLAFFNLGAAYASANPPRKSEAISQLQSFQKMVCKRGGSGPQPFGEQCSVAAAIARRLGVELQ